MRLVLDDAGEFIVAVGEEGMEEKNEGKREQEREIKRRKRRSQVVVVVVLVDDKSWWSYRSECNLS